jgi:hypothetical protein
MQNLKCAVFIPDPVPFDIEFLLFIKKQNKNHAFLCVFLELAQRIHIENKMRGKVK